MRPRWMLIGLVSFALIGVISYVVFHALRWQTWVADHSAVCDRIDGLTDLRPENIEADRWRQAVAETRNLVSQVYFSPSPDRTASLRDLKAALDERAQGQVNLDTLRWIWDKIQADNPTSRYPVDFWNDRLFGEPPVNDDSVLQLRSINRRWGLDLAGTAITDRGLQKLEGLSNLHVVILSNTQVTDDGVERLQRALPHCKIER